MEPDVAAPRAFPNVLDPRAMVVTMIPVFTGDAVTQADASAAYGHAWNILARPAGLVAGYCFASIRGESLLLYLQWDSLQALRNYRHVDERGALDPGLEPFGSANSPAYSLYRSLGRAPDAPTDLVCAYFDTDGPERQRYISDRLIELAGRLPENPTAVSAHFYRSLDGTRVVNYTEWSDAHTHDVHAEAGAYDEIYRISTTTPGVRSLRGNQYRCVAHCR